MGSRVLVALLAAAVATLRPNLADACTPGGITSASAAPKTGTVIPRNAPAVYVFPGWGYGNTCSLSSVSLTREPATPIPLLPGTTESTYLPATELEAGASYVLEYVGNCKYGGGKETFQATESQPLPLETGKLDVIASGTGFFPWIQGSCSFSTSGAWVRLRLRPSCELVPFLPVTRFIAEVNGKLWWRSGVGSTAASSNETIDSTTVDLIHAACGPGGWSRFPQGKYKVTMRAEIVGAPALPKPAELDVDLLCADGGASSPPPQAPGGLVDTALPCISDFDAATPTSDAGTDASADAAPEATSDATEDDAGLDGGAGGVRGGPEDACADVGETGAFAPEAGQPAHDRDLDAGGGCTGCMTDDRAPGSECAPFAMLIAAWLARRRRRRQR